MTLIFQYNVKKDSVYLKALKYYAKNNPKTYEFKIAKSLDNDVLNDMEGVYKYTTYQELKTYESNQKYYNKKQVLIDNYLNQ